MTMIGLLGGMSWPSTITYYRGINERVNARLGGSHSAQMLIWSDDYAQTEAEQHAEEWKAAGNRLAAAARHLEAAGAGLVGIACNTMHMVAPAVREAVGIPLIDLIEATATRAADLGITRAGLLGTAITMAMPNYGDELTAHGIELMLPRWADREALQHAIYGELCLGMVRPETGVGLRGIISRMVDDGADGIVLACTELNLVVDALAIGVPALDTTAVHIEAIVDAATA